MNSEDRKKTKGSPGTKPSPGGGAAAKAASATPGRAVRYTCRVCGYRYDPELGSPKRNIPPGISFEELPVGWACSVCGADQDRFERER
jgi:rubredoxin